MNVDLTPELEQLLQAKVKSGRYNSTSEVVREALRLLEEHDALRQARLDEVRLAIQHGNDQFARGEGLPGEAVFDNIRTKSQARRQATK